MAKWIDYSVDERKALIAKVAHHHPGPREENHCGVAVHKVGRIYSADKYAIYLLRRSSVEIVPAACWS